METKYGNEFLKVNIFSTYYVQDAEQSTLHSLSYAIHNITLYTCRFYF